VDDGWNPEKEAKDYVDDEVFSSAGLQEDRQRWKQNGQYDLNDLHGLMMGEPRYSPSSIGYSVISQARVQKVSRERGHNSKSLLHFFKVVFWAVAP
jgi:hypothetical protein